jgi:hypothetical protein
MTTFCDWTTDDLRCDLYAHEDAGAYVVHVATARVAVDVPRMPYAAKVPDYCRLAQQRTRHLAETPMARIDGPCDGATFKERSMGGLLHRMIWLRTQGYRVPDFVLDGVHHRIELARELAGSRIRELRVAA